MLSRYPRIGIPALPRVLASQRRVVGGPVIACHAAVALGSARITKGIVSLHALTRPYVIEPRVWASQRRVSSWSRGSGPRAPERGAYLAGASFHIHNQIPGEGGGSQSASGFSSSSPGAAS